jgi:tetratricopeptide (TPR) repeat protein
MKKSLAYPFLFLVLAGLAGAAEMKLSNERSPEDRLWERHETGKPGELDPKRIINESNNFLKEREPEMTAEEYALYEKVVTGLSSNPEFALKLLEAMMGEKEQPSPAFEFILGNVYYSAGQIDKAETRYRSAVKRYPAFIRAWTNLGVLYYTADKYAEATPCFSKAVTLGDHDPTTFGLLGYCLERSGNIVAAEMSYMQALSGNPESLDWMEGLLRVYIQGRQFGRAESLVKTLIRLRPAKAEFWLAHANILLAQNRKLEAIVLLEASVGAGFAGPDELNLLGDLYAEQGFNPEAAGIYQKIMAVTPDVGERKLLHFAQVLVAAEKLPLAEDMLGRLKVAELTPAGRPVYLQTKSDLLAARKQWREARKLLEELLQTEPLNGRALLSLGRTYAAEDDLVHAAFAFHIPGQPRAGKPRAQEPSLRQVRGVSAKGIEHREIGRGRGLPRSGQNPGRQKRLIKFMKTSIQTSLPILSFCSCRRLTLVVAAVFSSLTFADEPQSGASEPKTHSLFMGADFSIEQNKEIYRVQGVEGGAFVIKINGKEVRVPMNRGTVKLQINPSLKLTEALAIVANLKGERSYTLANDPTARHLRGLAQSAQLTAGNEAALNQASAAFTAGSAVSASVAANPVGGPPGAVTPVSGPSPSGGSGGSKTMLIANLSSQQYTQGLSQGPGSTFQDAKGNPLSFEGDFDAMDVAFEVSSERPLNNPYVVIIVQYRMIDGKPGQVGNWIYARSLDAIGRDLRKIHIEQGGFPPGFELQDFQVHLYNHGEEISTTVAPKRVMLTRDEAFQYVMLEYVSSHKGATLPATPAMGKIPADLSARLANGQLKPAYYVKVGKDGKASELFADESCSVAVNDPYLDALIKNFRFKPALDKGKPVDGVALFKLNQLPI